MRYTLHLALDADLPVSRLETLTATLDEHGCVWEHWGVSMLGVSGPSQEVVERACRAGLQRIGRTLEEVVVDLF